MSPTIVVLAGLSLGTYLLKAAGPVLLGSRPLPPVVAAVADRMPAALLAALVVVSAIGADRAVVVDERIVGVAVAAAALRARVPFVFVVVAAVAATAAARAIT